MIKGGDKQTLPMIEEDVRQSLDSISTLESDNLTLEHIESELFGDIRASIQKVAIPTSGDLSAKTDNVANSCKLIVFGSGSGSGEGLLPIGSDFF